MTKIYHDSTAVMENFQEPDRTLEVKIRPFSNPKSQDPPHQNGASRIHLNSEALRDLDLKAGQICYLWKADEGLKHMREAIVWPTNEKSMSKKIVQMTKPFQEATGFKLADDLKICAPAIANQIVKAADIISLRDVTGQDVPELTEEERFCWQWFVKREYLSRADVVFAGMTFQNIKLSGPLRTFKVESVNGSTTSLGTFDASSSVKISNHIDVTQPRPKFEVINIAGIDQALKNINEFLAQFDKEFKFQKGQRSCATLLHGGHGTGKTFILDKICKSGWAKHVMKVRSDAKPDTIRTVFKNAKLSQPSIIIIDNLERLVGKEDSVSEKMTDALEEELGTLSESHSGASLPRVVVVAATKDISLIPHSLRKLGRFMRDIPLVIPDAAARKAILRSLDPQFSPDTRDKMVDRLGDRTHAYTAEDLAILLSRAYEIAETKVNYDVPMDNYYIEQEDLEHALLDVRPTAMHDITLQPPSVRWDEIGGQDSVKQALRVAVETPLIRHERVKRLGGSPTKGILLYGPPGCSKTLTAQAMATEIGFNFFAVKGAELLNMYVGESERAVRNIFARARAASPSIIFFDEIESIGSKRESSGKSNGVNVLTTLLNEMDGIETLKGVTVLAATNQPQALDLALLRPGRFDQLLYVAPPDLQGREEILRVKKRKMDFADDVDIPELAKMTDGYSGAELVGICQTAFRLVLKKCEGTGEELQIHMEDFLEAIPQVKKQITPALIWNFEQWGKGTGAAGIPTLETKGLLSGNAGTSGLFDIAGAS